MKINLQYRQLLFFIAVLLVLNILIGVQGQMIVRRDREKRLEEAAIRDRQERDGTRAVIAKDLWDKLENIKLQLIRSGAAADPAVRFVGWTDGEKLAMPWEEMPGAERFRQAIEERRFAQEIDDADRAEYAEKNPERAAIVLRDLIQTAHNADQRVYARLLLARVLRNSGNQAERLNIYRDLLGLPSDVVNDGGLSVASLAAASLATSSAGQEAFERVKQELQSPAMTLSQAYWLRDGVLSEFEFSPDAGLRAAASVEDQRLRTRIAGLESVKKDLEQDPEFLSFRQEFPGLDVTDKSWQPYGATLLISKTSAGSAFKPLVIAVKRASIFDAARSSNISGPAFQLVAGGDSGEALDSQRLSNLRVRFTPAAGTPQTGADLQRALYVPALLVMGLTLVGGILLWRDTQRASRMAALRSQFVSSVSHELKTPLTSIRMFAEILQTCNPADEQMRAECVDIIVNESDRLTRLLDNVLDFSRIDQGQRSYRMEPTRLVEVVTDAVKTMQRPMAEQGFDLRLNIDDGMPPVEADRDALKQAVLNLLTNAMKYSGQSRNIEVRLFSESGNAFIQVADHGIGIPAAEQSRIFERFYRAPVVENHAISGTGLGLALVAHIAEVHGGSVEVKSSLGAGSIFSVRIPVRAGAGG